MKTKQLTLFAGILFFVNPLLSIIWLAQHCISVGNKTVNDNNKAFVFLFAILCCIFISLVNMMKVPESDLVNYVDRYQMASHYSWYAYLFEGTYDKGGLMKEPLYSTLVWVINRICCGNVKAFLFTISMIEYWLCLIAIIYFGKILGMRIYVVIVGIILMCFLPYIFTHTMHLVRQSLANGLLCYVMVRHFFYKRKEWIGMAVMVFIHTTSALFVPLLLIPGFGKPLKKAWIWYVGVFGFLVGIKILTSYLLGWGFFGANSAVAYALGRATGEYSYDRYELSTSIVIFIVVMLVYSLFVYLGKLIPSSEELRRFSFVFIFTALFILMNLDEDLLSARYSHYLFTLVPFMVMIGLQFWKIRSSFLFLLSIGIIIFFTTYLKTGAWTYDISFGPWLTPVLGYLI